MNLVGNAIKFTERGEVSLEITPESPSEQGLMLQFVVRDTGIGIPDDKQAAIFGMFEQVDSSSTRRHGGAGLGLSIAARLVGLMDGRLWVESEVGRGSRFHFTRAPRLASSDCCLGNTIDCTRHAAALQFRHATGLAGRGQPG